MSGEIQFTDKPGGQDYVLLLDGHGQFWHAIQEAFEPYDSGSYPDYALAAVEQGGSGIYLADAPVALAAGGYGVVARRQAGASPVEADPTVAQGRLDWTGTGPYEPALAGGKLAADGLDAIILAQPTVAPVFGANLPVWLAWLAALAKNPQQQSSAEQVLFRQDASAPIASRNVSDNGLIFTANVWD
jgi:hypothetical protein